MNTRNSGHFDELPSVETPEDVAVLYSWANLHGAKYRDFSASRREYRAQLRHRAAEQAREVEVRTHAEAERNVKEAERMRTEDRHLQSGSSRPEASHTTGEAAAQMEVARRERETAEATASARRQAANRAETQARSRQSSRRDEDASEVPGKISDPYTPEFHGVPEEANPAQPGSTLDAIRSYPGAYRRELQGPDSQWLGASDLRPGDTHADPSHAVPTSGEGGSGGVPVRRPQGYRPDDASGVRQIYRPDADFQGRAQTPRSMVAPGTRHGLPATPSHAAAGEVTLASIAASEEQIGHNGMRPTRTAVPEQPARAAAEAVWAPQAMQRPRRERAEDHALQGDPALPRTSAATRAPSAGAQRVESAGQLEDPTPKRRRQDLATSHATDSDRAIAAYRREQSQPLTYTHAPLGRPVAPSLRTPHAERPREQPAHGPGRPAWITPQPAISLAAPAFGEASRALPEVQDTVAETLQRSRERVASRWYALKGVFEQAGAERQETQPVRQKETRTPVLAVFSLAGGVGKTSLVAALGRSLSSLGEKVLLTDTTSHGLLPFYFGASELREGTVRTFSPPSGSTDAPIYLVNYGIDRTPGDEESQEALIEAIATSGRGTHRILLDLTAHTGWIVNRMASMNPTILIPVAPDMNSVISLQTIEKSFHGLNGAEGAPLKFFYLLNQFDAALPLHLDVREVLRRQLGERLLPFVVRRAPAVSEALAEGMTIIDYSPDAPVAEDYMAVASWLRSQSAPATAGFRNVRWSER